MGERLSHDRGIGVGRLGVGGEPSRRRTTPELCPLFFHPPATYNPWLDRTWCLCGSRTYPGDHSTLIATGSGPLTEPNPEHIRWEETQQGKE